MKQLTSSVTFFWNSSTMMRFILLIFSVNALSPCDAETTVPTPLESSHETTVSTESITHSTAVPDSSPVTALDEKLTVASTKRDETTSLATTTEAETTTMDVLQKWKHFENITKLFAKKSIKGLLPGLMEGIGKMNISASCQRDGFKLLVGLRDIKTWAFSFLDASGKFMDGMLDGTMSNIGEFDQCLDIRATEDRRGKNFGKVMFTGQYCALDIKPPLPPKKKYYKLNEVVDELKNFSQGGNIISEAAKTAQFFHFLSMRIGICVPSGCRASDIQELVNTMARDIKWTVRVNRCQVKKENEYTPLVIGVMTAMCFFGFMMLVGSLVELYHYCSHKKINGLPLQILVCFSLISNFKKLANTKTSSGKLNCLHGFRFLSISWIILGHTYLNINFQLFRGLRRATLFPKDFFFQAVINASVAVDTFFFIGGLLVCYATINIVKEMKKPLNIPVYILHRLFRLLPLYVMVILFIFLAPILGSGPVYNDSIDKFVDACYNNWWTNILFVNNFVNAYEICLPQSWYVSCDMQLYIAALIVLIPILRWPRVGVTMASLGILASVIGTTAMTYAYEYPPTMLFVHPDIEQRTAYWANAYFKPYSHAGPYCIGLLIGYLLATQPKLKFSLGTRIIGWCLAIATNMAVLYGVYDWNKGRDPELYETLLYSGLHRVAWTAGVAWVVVNCFTGQGGVVNYILCWKCWVPLGRLTYAAYLIHPIVQISAVGNARMKIQTAHYFAVWMYFGHLLITYGCSFAASMLVEAPFISLEKIILTRATGKPQATTNGTSARAGDEEQDKPENENQMNGTATNGYVSKL